MTEKTSDISQKFWFLEGIEKDNLLNFVGMCSRFEYALKQVPEYRKKKGKIIKVCWERYSREHDDKIRKDASLSAAIQEFEKQTIRKQIINESNDLHWTDDETQLILMMVYRVRNNLFHGGKENNINTSKNNELLKYGAEILSVAQTLNEQVRSAFRKV